ncbi:MD-2-related lipid-recognition protein-like [Vanessa tameamea]|uniref:MD-2-related lipid-recognition protein-like n=1 Tax=Vanessa tameamea TaxID=334116 RepID=A0A8B8HZK1_VANTA
MRLIYDGRSTVPFINCILKTMDVRFFILFAFYINVNCEYVNRKFCKNVDLNKCSIHSMKLDPCPDGPGFCLIRRDMPYSLAFDFTPHFEAEKLKFSIFSDESNSGTFNGIVTPPVDACEYHSCPLEDNVRQVFDIDFEYTRKAHGKFPIEMRLWNAKDDSDVCCFPFNVQMLK